MKKIMAIVLMAAMLLSLGAVVINAEDAAESTAGYFDSLEEMSNFSEKNIKKGFTGNKPGTINNSELSLNDDGSVHVVALPPVIAEPGTDENGETMEQVDFVDYIVNVDISYFNLMLEFYTGFPDGMKTGDKIALLPNSGREAEDALNVVVFKVKRSEAARMQEVSMYFQVGYPPTNSGGHMGFSMETMVMATPVVSSDEYEYLVFDMAEYYPAFSEDFINAVRLNWVYDIWEVGTSSAEDMWLDLYAVNLYTDLDAATTALGLTVDENYEPVVPGETEPDSESGSESVSESVSETASETEKNTAKETASTAESATATETEKSGGCGSVVGVSAVAVVLSAVAAAIVLKKKD